MTWTVFAAVFAAFFVTHSIPVQPAIKARIVSFTGPRGFTLAYSALSLTMLALLIWSAGQAPYVELWSQQPWQRHVVHLGMFAVCGLLALSLGQPNPFSFGGARNDQFDPSHPGIVRWMRHPILVALALWAGLHLLPNGDLAHVILFGVLGVFAVAGGSLIDRRKRRDMGDAHWHALKDAMQHAARGTWPRSWFSVMIRLALGGFAFLALLLAHPYVIGVSAL